MEAYELGRLDANAFEQLVNMLVMRTLGRGAMGFGPGPDGGRDGYYEGSAPYPSANEHWNGVWYVQSKFHKPHLSSDPQKWLIQQVRDELSAFAAPDSDREWPDNWIIASNIDPTGKPETGSFDRIRELVRAVRPQLAARTHVWGGSKLISLLSENVDVAASFGHLISPGHVLQSVYASVMAASAADDEIIRDIVVTSFDRYKHTRLDQAGSDSDNRPGIQALYTDIPFLHDGELRGYVARAMAAATILDHSRNYDVWPTANWLFWSQQPERSRVWFIKGGPGQGKSTSTQFMAQVNRAAVMLEHDGPSVSFVQRQEASQVRMRAEADGVWPLQPRLPVTIELREFAQWYGKRTHDDSTRLLAYWRDALQKSIGHDVKVGAIKRMLSSGRWMFIFDGLDEVPGDVKDEIAFEITHFVDNDLVGLGSDAFIVCTSRPQGYSGQFDLLQHTQVDLAKLSPDEALACAKPVIFLDRSREEADRAYSILKESIRSPAVQEIMTTPLQSHIMAVVVRNGHRPPDRKWQLFQNFYEVIRKREANRTLPNPKLAGLLSRGDKLIKSLHARLGFDLHTKAEQSSGATTSLARDDFKNIVQTVVTQLQDEDIDETVAVLMEAATERLVLVNTPENGEFVRFDIRPLQEFFAAEYLYESTSITDLSDKLFIIAGDSHWREVIHFLISAMVENNRKGELAIAVSILDKLNVAAEGDATRELSKRLALGASQAARLLSEGVLEQDKRIRAQFRQSIESLSACTDALKLLGTVGSMHSRSWLVDVLLDALRERSEADSIGAALLLCEVLEDGDRRVGEAVGVLEQSSIVTRRFLARSLRTRYGAWSNDLPRRWVQEYAARELSGEDWIEYGPELTGLLSITAKRSRSDALGPFSYPPETWEAIQAVCGAGHLAKHRHPSSVDVEMYGSVPMILICSDTRRNIAGWAPDRLLPLKELGGLFEGFALILMFTLGDRRSGMDFVEWCNADKRRLQGCPSILKDFVNEDVVESCCDQRDIDSSILDRDQPGEVAHFRFPAHISDIDWPSFLKSKPWILQHMITYGHDDIYVPFADYLNAVGDFTDFSDALSSGMMDSCLGPLFGYLQETSAPDACLEMVRARAMDVEPEVFVGSNRRTFKLSLPGDAALLPFALMNVVAIARDSTSVPLHRRTSEKIVSSDWSTSFGIAQKTLLETAASEDIDCDHRAAALMLAVLTSDGSLAVKLSIETALEMAAQPTASWLRIGALLALSDGVMDGDAEQWALASSLLEEVRDDLFFRQLAEPLLRRWREKTGSPVSASLGRVHWH